MKSYKQYFETEEEKKIAKRALCTHIVWRKICSSCGQTLDNEKLHEGDHEETLIDT
jgi:hypothetical protein